MLAQQVDFIGQLGDAASDAGGWLHPALQRRLLYVQEDTDDNQQVRPGYRAVVTSWTTSSTWLATAIGWKKSGDCLVAAIIGLPFRTRISQQRAAICHSICWTGRRQGEE